MKSNKVEFFNETIYHEKLDCGIDVYILKNKDKEDAYVTLTTKYGGYNKPFLCDGKYITVPNGIAHFLEHKVFEQKEGIDPFSFYGKTGTYCNAATNYYNTTYVFAGNKNFNENGEKLANNSILADYNSANGNYGYYERSSRRI